MAKLAKEEGMADKLGKVDLVAAPEHPQFQAFTKNLEMRRAGKKVPDTTAPLNFANMRLSYRVNKTLSYPTRPRQPVWVW